MGLTTSVIDGAVMCFGPDLDHPGHMFVSVMRNVTKDVTEDVVTNNYVAMMGSPPAWALDVTSDMDNQGSAVTFGTSTYCFFQTAGALCSFYYDGTELSDAVQVPGVSITGGPAAVVYDGQLYVFYQQAGGSQQLMYISSSNASTWSSPAAVPGQYLTTSASAVVYGSDLYVFYQGMDNDGTLYYNVYNGSSWSQGMTVPGAGISQSPAAVIYGSDIYVFYQNAGDGGELLYSTYGGSWSSPVQVAGAAMTASPAAISYSETIILFYESAALPGQLWLTLYNGSTWTAPDEVMPVALSCSPGAVVYDGELAVFMQGPDTSGELWFTVWNGNVISWMMLVDADLSAVMSYSPGPVVFTPPGAAEPQLYVFYNGPSTNGQLHYSLFNGSGWSQGQIIPTGKSSSTGIMSFVPSAVVFNGQLYVFYQGGSQDSQLWYNMSADASNWGAQTELIPAGKSSNNDTMSASPSAVVYDGRLWVFYQAGKNSAELWYNASADGSDWGTQYQLNTSSSGGSIGISYKTGQSPSAVVYDGQLYVFWSDDDCQLCYNLYNGSSWSGPYAVPITTSYYADMAQTPSAVVYTPPGATSPQLYVFYQGGTPVAKGEYLGGAQQLWWTSYNGSSWTPNTQVGNYQIAGAPTGAALAEGVSISQSLFMSLIPQVFGID
jgi:hypothetical protein